MKIPILLVFILASVSLNAQISTFLKSKEFQEVKINVSKIKFNNLEDIWLSGFEEDDKPEVSNNSYTWNDADSYHQILLSNNKVVITYHLNAGSNTGTLIYDRVAKSSKTFPFYSNKIISNALEVTREGYGKQGHWWQNGKMNLMNGIIVWNKNLEN